MYTTVDSSAVSVGSTVYTCMLNKDGGVEADLTVSILNPGTGSAHSPDFQGLFLTVVTANSKFNRENWL